MGERSVELQKILESYKEVRSYDDLHSWAARLVFCLVIEDHPQAKKVAEFLWKDLERTKLEIAKGTQGDLGGLAYDMSKDICICFDV